MYHFKTRNVVRKAIKSGIKIIEESNDLETLYQIHLDNMTAIGGKAKEKDFFEEISKRFIPGTDYRVFYAIKDDQKIAGLMNFYFNKTVDYFTPVVVQEFRSLQPLSFLIHNAMVIAGHEGYRFWNWGGSWETQKNLIHFKERWGGEIRNYRYFTTIANQAIYSEKKDTIEKNYPGFFVVPYNLLNQEA
jgi:lipid II:glycine glycyltransferase (peptidoglycan interpeptide bridge formation enzyme)